MPQMTLFGTAASASKPAEPKLSKQPATSASNQQRKARPKEQQKRHPQPPPPPLPELRDPAARAKAVWAQLHAQRDSGVVAAALWESGLASGPPRPTAGSSSLDRLRAKEAAMVQAHQAARHAQENAPQQAARSQQQTAGWRRMRDGERAFVTTSGKRLTGKVAHAAAKRQKSS